MRGTRVRSLVLVALAQSALLADEGRIPIFGPTTITQPGSYVLTRNITSGTDPVLDIRANNVTLDLNGHTVSASASSAIVIRIADGFRDVTIRNGRLSGGCAGIRYFTTSDTLTRLRVETVEIQPVIRVCSGIQVYGAEYVEVMSSRIISAYQGIWIDNVLGSFGGRFVNNIIDGAGQSGLMLDGLSAGELRGNVIRGYGVDTFGWGIRVQVGNNPAGPTGGNIIQENTVRGGGSDDIGIEISAALPATSDRNLVIKNVVTSGGTIGINVVTSGNLVSQNIVSGGTNHGIQICCGSRNLVENNQIEGNTGCGINFTNAGFHAYRGNMLRGNVGGAVCGSANTDAGGNIL